MAETTIVLGATGHVGSAVARALLRRHASRLGADDSADLLVALTATTASGALAVVFDLSDSAQFTSRSAARLPGLLRGWDRTMPVWAYALGDVRPLRIIPAGTVGDLIDGTLDLSGPLADAALVSAYRRRGSFIAPTFVALNDRAAAEGVGALRVIVLSDGRPSDFEPAPSTAADVVGLLEPGDDAAAARAAWTRVMGDVPLCTVGDAAVQAWLSARRPPSAVRTVRLVGNRVRALTPLGTPSAGADGLEWLPAHGPLFVLVPPASHDAFRIACRHGDDAAELDARQLAAAPAVAEADMTRAKEVFGHAKGGPFLTVYDSHAQPQTLDAGWQFAAEAFSAASKKLPWPATRLPDISAAADRAVAMICWCNRRPDGPATAGDRVVVIGLLSKSDGIALRPGDPLAFGIVQDEYAVSHDRFEDRWHATVGTADGIRSRFELHPIASDHLPPLRAADTNWSGVFSGLLR